MLKHNMMIVIVLLVIKYFSINKSTFIIINHMFINMLSPMYLDNSATVLKRSTKTAEKMRIYILEYSTKSMELPFAEKQKTLASS